MIKENRNFEAFDYSRDINHLYSLTLNVLDCHINDEGEISSSLQEREYWTIEKGSVQILNNPERVIVD